MWSQGVERGTLAVPCAVWCCAPRCDENSVFSLAEPDAVFQRYSDRKLDEYSERFAERITDVDAL